MSTAQDVRAKLEPVLVGLGLVVEDISVTPAGKRRLVRVLVDTDISGLDDSRHDDHRHPALARRRRRGDARGERRARHE